MTPVLSVQSLQVSLSKHPIVRGVSFDAPAGRWFGLLGANGSGKTTLLRALNGRLPIDSGTVRLVGEDITKDTAARAGHIGFAPPPDALPAELTAGQLLDLLGRMRSTNPREPAHIYEALGVAALEKIAIWRMSAGMRQRVSVFTAFIGAPAVVLLDEPFNWLDPVAAHDLKLMLAEWVAAGGALVTALHDIATFATRCDLGLLIHDGKVARAFDAGEMAAGRGDVLGFEEVVYQTFKAAGR